MAQKRLTRWYKPVEPHSTSLVRAPDFVDRNNPQLNGQTVRGDGEGTRLRVYQSAGRSARDPYMAARACLGPQYLQTLTEHCRSFYCPVYSTAPESDSLTTHEAASEDARYSKALNSPDPNMHA